MKLQFLSVGWGALGILFLAGCPESSFQGYRYDVETRECRNAAGQRGLNPGYVGECGDLRGADLVFLLGRTEEIPLSFRGSNLSGAKLNGLNLAGADATDADLSGVQLKMAHLLGIRFVRTRLEGTNFQQATLINCEFSDVQARGADFSRAKISGSKFNTLTTDLSRASFNGAQLEKNDFSRARLDRATFREATLTDNLFEGVRAAKMDWEYAQTIGSVFTQAVVTGSRFRFTRFNEGVRYPEKTPLTNSFREVLGKHSSFEGAQLGTVDLSEAKLQGSDFRGTFAKLARTGGTQLEGSIYNDQTTMPFPNSEARVKGMRHERDR